MALIAILIALPPVLRASRRCFSAASAATAASSSAAPPFFAPASALTLTAFERPGDGKYDARRARQNGLIPGIVYGPGVVEKRVFVSAEALRQELHRRRDTFLSTVVDLQLGDTRIRVLPRDIQLHPFRPKLLSLNWLAYVPGRYPGIKLDLPLKAINAERCPGYKEGGWLLELMYKLPVWVRGDVVPPYLAMDLRGKRLGDKIMASELNLGEGVQLRWSHGHDFAVAKLVGSRRGLEEEAAAAAPAAGEKAAAGEKGAKPAGGAAPAAAEKAAPAKK